MVEGHHRNRSVQDAIFREDAKEVVEVKVVVVVVMAVESE